MTTKRWNAAPEPEWVRMYRLGLGRGKIAELTGAPVRTVGYHLTAARRLYPGLQTEHKEAARGTRRRVTRQGLEHMHQLLEMVQESGRYPSTKANNKSERALAAWLNRRRIEARDGRLLAVFRDGLDALPDWQDLRRIVRDEARWQERLTALEAYRESGEDWPRHKATITGLEHDLGVWLHTQRDKAHQGKLAPDKLDALNVRVPGWQLGRIRGRKSMGASRIDSARQ